MQEKTAALERLVEIIDVLRGPDGCPWDRVQTLPDMSRYLLEEVSEAVDAIDSAEGKPTAHVCEELGDVLMNVLLSSRIAEDAGGFDVGDVARGIAEKLVRRHPHVFGDRSVRGVADVLSNWDVIKAAEKPAAGANPDAADREPPSRLDTVPRNLPVLERAHALARRAAKFGFDWPDARGAFNKVIEETDEVRVLLEERESGQDSDPALLEAELGDLLFAVANLCRKLDVPPDVALRRTLRKFCARFRVVESEFPELEKTTLEEMESAWQQAKKSEEGPKHGSAGRDGP